MLDILDLAPAPEGVQERAGASPERVEILSRAEVEHCAHWRRAFEGQRKDHRYYEIIEDCINPEFQHRYFVIRDIAGEVAAIQPFFLLDQDLLAGLTPRFGPTIRAIRRVLPRFMIMRALMLGCAAGEGHLDGPEAAWPLHAELIAQAIAGHARQLKAPLIVLKEFPAKYRAALSCFLAEGFTRVPSLPMTKLSLDYTSFDDYMNRALKGRMRRELGKKFRAATQRAPIAMEAVRDISPFVDEVYPLYLQVYERSPLHFEKLTKEFLCRLGRKMSDKTQFFLWRQDGKIIAFASVMLQGDSIYGENIGFDYRVALQLHLYHLVTRDVMSWAITNGYKCLRGGALNYDPKLHMRHVLDPIDLYVRHTSPAMNAILKRALRYMEPTRHDKTLRKFPNYADLWGDAQAIEGA